MLAALSASASEVDASRQIYQLLDHRTKMEQLRRQMSRNLRVPSNTDLGALSMIARAQDLSKTDGKAARTLLLVAKKQSSPTVKLLASYFLATLLMERDAVEAANAELLAIKNQSSVLKQWPSLGRLVEIVELQILARMDRHHDFSKKYKRFERSLGPRERFPELAKLAVQSYLALGDGKKAEGALEELLETYPLSKTSRWAFSTLWRLHCEGTYQFSTRVLYILARNSTLDYGVRELLSALVRTKLRKGKQSARVLSDVEQVGLLSGLRNYSDALATGRSALASGELDSNDRARLLRTLGDVASKLRKHQLALRFFSQYRALRPNSKKSEIIEAIADNLRYLGLLRIASPYYQKLSRRRDGKLAAWHYYWGRYRFGEFKSLAMAPKSKFSVFRRDKEFPEGSAYWRGVLLDGVGKTTAATSAFADVIRQSPFGFYSGLVQGRRPSLSPPKRRDFNAAGSQYAAVAAPPKNRDAMLLIVQGLADVGLFKLARQMLADVDLGSAVERDFRGSLDLAVELELFGVGEKIARIARRNAVQKVHLPVAELARLEYPLAFNRLVTTFSEMHRVDRYLLLSVMRAESRYNPLARSWVGARGLMQIMPYTALRIARRIGDDEFDLRRLNVPEINIGYGAWYLRELIDYFDGNEVFAVAAYNAGPRAVQAWLSRCAGCRIDEFVESISYRETRKYVKEVYLHWSRYRALYEDGVGLNVLPLQVGQIRLGDEQMF